MLVSLQLLIVAAVPLKLTPPTTFGFGANQNVVGGVSFNGTAATISNWSDTSITATVPQNATTGNVIVTTAANLVSAGVNFTVGTPPTFSLSASPSTATAPVGDRTAYTLSMTPVNGFTGSVSLSVSGLPAGLTANFIPSSTVDNSTSSTGLLITAA